MSTLMLWQDPQPVPPKPPVVAASATKEAPDKLRALPEASDREARKAVRAFKQAMKGKPSMAKRLTAVEALVVGANKSMVKPLVAVVVSDKSVLVRRRAAEFLSLQPAKQTQPAILQLLDNDRVKDTAPVMAALITGLSRVGYRAKDWRKIRALFERDYSADRVQLQEAVLDLVIEHKEKKATKLLLDNLDEPIPVDVDSPHNPPASYWEARWKAWRAWRPRVKEALFAITGQRFSTAEEARNWLRKNPLK